MIRRNVKNGDDDVGDILSSSVSLQGTNRSGLLNTAIILIENYCGVEDRDPSRGRDEDDK